MTDQPEIVNKTTGEITPLKVDDWVRIPSIQSSGQVKTILPPYCKVRITRHLNRGIRSKQLWTGAIAQCERM